MSRTRPTAGAKVPSCGETLSAENLELVRRFGGSMDRYGLGQVVIDCSASNLNALLDAARATSGVIPTPAGTGGDDSHATLEDDASGMPQNPSFSKAEGRKT